MWWKSASSGGEAVEEEAVADVGRVWTILAVEKGRTRAKGWRRPTEKEAALRTRSTKVAFVHKNKFGVLEVAGGDQTVCAVGTAVQVRELEVAQVSAQVGSRFARKSGPKHLGSKWRTGAGVGQCQWGVGLNTSVKGT